MLKPLQTVSTSSRPTEQAQSVGYVPNSVKTIIDPGLTSQTTGHEALIGIKLITFDNLLLDKSSTMGDILPGVNSGISSGISETQQIPTEPQPESETSGPPEETTQNDMPELTAGATSLDDGSSVAPKKPKRKRQRKPKINVPKDTQVQGTEGLLSGTKIVDESSTSENIAAQPTSRKGRKRTTKNEKNDEPRPLTHRQRINALAAEAVTLVCRNKCY
ncbi:hypothetical protein RF11_00584 [Thelohanellus kitauei]|uniref:Uncharacterized protein n=1 Tax=Thelohanellus kitauei TaxID=669202 RepID=A0A0C2J4I3_THEKT|nr:hypothetical protein RF11_00584 [Thelohanellus kitauei]